MPCSCAFMPTATASLAYTSHSIMVGRMHSGTDAAVGRSTGQRLGRCDAHLVGDGARSHVQRAEDAREAQRVVDLVGEVRPAGGDDARAAAVASHGQISGTGLAQAKTMASSAMALIHSDKGARARLAQRNHRIRRRRASAILPLRPSALVIWHSRHLSTYSARRIKIWPVPVQDALAVHNHAFGRVHTCLEAEPGDRYVRGAEPMKTTLTSPDSAF